MRVEEQKILLGKIQETLEKFKKEKRLSKLEENILRDDINHYYHGIGEWRNKVFDILNNL